LACDKRENNIIEKLIEPLIGGKRLSMKGLKRRRPMVSVITVVFNGDKTLEDTIKSVIKQDYDSFEYLIIDGGSQDGTLKIIQEYEQQIDYWISEPDNGIYDAMNKGIELANGRWIYFIGADDVLVGDTVLSQVFKQKLRGDLIYGNVLWGDTGKVYDGPFTLAKLKGGNICQQAIFYRRSLLYKLGKFNTKYRYLADWVFNMRAFAKWNIKAIYIDTIVARYALSGISSREVDVAFLADMESLFRDIFWRDYREEERKIKKEEMRLKKEEIRLALISLRARIITTMYDAFQVIFPSGTKRRNIARYIFRRLVGKL
jgi:glycosyltransferase involved in cell wall biosynthesis